MKDRSETVSFRLPHSVDKELQARAEARGMSRHEYARILVLDGLERHEVAQLRQDLANSMVAALVQFGKVPLEDATNWAQKTLLADGGGG